MYATLGNPDLECHPYAVVAQFDPVDEFDPCIPWNRLRFPIGGKEPGLHLRNLL